MDPKVLYWTGALANFAVIVWLVTRGVRAIRSGDVARHRRSMLTGGALVLAFLGSYVLKLLFLGRERLDLWSQQDLWILRFHETCVALMLLGGGVALQRAWRMRETRSVTRSASDPLPRPEIPRWHRRAGWTAVTGAVLGLVSAAFVLVGMYQRG